MANEKTQKLPKERVTPKSGLPSQRGKSDFYWPTKGRGVGTSSDLDLEDIFAGGRPEGTGRYEPTRGGGTMTSERELEAVAKALRRKGGISKPNRRLLQQIERLGVLGKKELLDDALRRGTRGVGPIATGAGIAADIALNPSEMGGGSAEERNLEGFGEDPTVWDDIATAAGNVLGHGNPLLGPYAMLPGAAKHGLEMLQRGRDPDLLAKRAKWKSFRHLPLESLVGGESIAAKMGPGDAVPIDVETARRMSELRKAGMDPQDAVEILLGGKK